MTKLAEPPRPDKRGSPKPYRMHDIITAERVCAAVKDYMELNNPGFCVLCGAGAEGVEPDAREYACEACGAEDTVYGAEELLLYVAA